MGIKVDECYALKRQLLGANGPVDQWQRFVVVLHNVDRQLASHVSQQMNTHIVGGACIVVGVANSI